MSLGAINGFKKNILVLLLTFALQCILSILYERTAPFSGETRVVIERKK